MVRKKNRKILFIGDETISNITSKLIHEYPHHEFVNAQQKGDTIHTLVSRFEIDALDQKPDVIFIFIGKHDSQKRRHDKSLGTTDSMSEFKELYQQILTKTDRKDIRKVVLVEPFYVSYPFVYDAIRFDVQDKIFAVRKLAIDFQYYVLGLDGILNQNAINNGRRKVVKVGGVTPSKRGDEIVHQAVREMIDQWESKR